MSSFQHCRAVAIFLYVISAEALYFGIYEMTFFILLSKSDQVPLILSPPFQCAVWCCTMLSVIRVRLQYLGAQYIRLKQCGSF